MSLKLFWFWKRNIPVSGVNAMSADALAPEVARASAGMVLAVEDRQYVLLFQS